MGPLRSEGSLRELGEGLTPLFLFLGSLGWSDAGRPVNGPCLTLLPMVCNGMRVDHCYIDLQGHRFFTDDEVSHRGALDLYFIVGDEIFNIFANGISFEFYKLTTQELLEVPGIIEAVDNEPKELIENYRDFLINKNNRNTKHAKYPRVSSELTSSERAFLFSVYKEVVCADCVLTKEDI